MKKLFLISFLFCAITANAQKGFPNYYEYIRLASEGDSLYKARDFRNAAIRFLAAANIKVEKGVGISPNDMYYNAACSFALVKKTNDAFDCLSRLVNGNYSDYEGIIADPDFNNLHGDKRWDTVVAQIRENKQSQDRKNHLIEQRSSLTTEMSETIFYPYTDYAKQFLQNDSLCFLSVNHEHFRLFFTGNSFASKNLEKIKTALSSALNKGLSVLDTNIYDRGINIIFVDSPEEMQELTGFYIHGGMACPGHDLVFFVCNNNRRWQFRHELFHLISNQVWGYAQSRLVNEGGAMYADNECYYDNPVYAITAYLLRTGKSFPVAALIEDFDSKASESEVIAYMESAAVFKYLYEKYGIEKMKLLWVKGFSEFKSIYGMSVEEFQKEWSNFLNTVPSPPDLDIEKILTHGCG